MAEKKEEKKESHHHAEESKKEEKGSGLPWGTIIIILIVVAAFVIVTLSKRATPPEDIEIPIVENETIEEVVPIIPEGPKTYVIEMTSEGFLPENITLREGDSVKWVVVGPTRHWPASDPHPLHDGYPQKTGMCRFAGSSDFNACRALNRDEYWTFTFNQSGTWGYHDHLNPSWKGVVNVEGGAPAAEENAAGTVEEGSGINATAAE